MTKKDYERAAGLIQAMHGEAKDNLDHGIANASVHLFVRFFADDNPRFDEARFRAACVPGANVRARKVKVA